MMRTLIAGLLLFGAGETAAGPGVDGLPNLRLQIGSMALVSLKPDGQPEVVGSAAPGLTAGELDMLGQLLARSDDALGEKSLGVSTHLYAQPVVKGHVRFSFLPAVNGEHSVLIIRNGFDQSFAYRARIGSGAKSSLTDVCQVLPGIGAVEHWPYKIEWIEISDIRAAPWKTGDQPRCE